MRSCLISAFVLAICCSMCLADAPGILNFQGRLTTTAGLNVPDGPHTVRFSIYNGPAGNIQVTDEASTFALDLQLREVNAVLGHDHIVRNSETVRKSDGSATYTRGTAYSINNVVGVLTSLGNPLLIPSGTAVLVTYQWAASPMWTETEVVQTSKGLFAATLGSVTPISASVLTGSDWMQVEVQNPDNSYDAMLPRQRLAAAPYALALALPYAAGANVSNPGSLISVTNVGNGTAISAISQAGIGIHAGNGTASGVYPALGSGIWGDSHDHEGVLGTSASGLGVSGYSTTYTGVEGIGGLAGVRGFSSSGNGVLAETYGAGASGLYAMNHAGGPSVAGYCPSTGLGVGLFAGDLGAFGAAAIETNMSQSTTHIFCAENGNPVFYVAAGGAVHALSYANLSDSRYKKSIRTVSNPLASIEGLRGVSFEWNPATGRSFPKGRQLGFLAQEVRKVLPELVSEDEKGYLSVEYANVVPVLVEAVKVLKADNDAKAAQIARLRVHDAAFEARLRRLERRERIFRGARNGRR